MLTENDKDIIKTMMAHPGWSLLERAMKENALNYRLQAEMPEVEEHYRLILFAKAQGIDELFTFAQVMIR